MESQEKQGKKASKAKRVTVGGVVVLLLLITALIVQFYRMAYGQPYPRDITAAEVPTFDEVSLPSIHAFDNSTLPFLASAAIDVDGDQQPELFLGGGLNQQDALYKFKGGSFVEMDRSCLVEKSLPDASLGAACADFGKPS